MIKSGFPRWNGRFGISYLHRGTEFRQGEIRWFRGLEFELACECLVATVDDELEGA